MDACARENVATTLQQHCAFGVDPALYTILFILQVSGVTKVSFCFCSSEYFKFQFFKMSHTA
ncbi:Hypothetical protein CINCED_3A017729 [Cinara cedri]|uniref:Uncharacterized protein n=1 Tax=Cinara cedri TaxID=506608 RepID=A0A5E4NE42_9HEMI|nr:Hypothetical protein CINCED_3A017729 [Cinara cedri]